MKHLPAAMLLTATLSSAAFAMNNYDDPRISTGFLDESLTGALDILKVTLRAKERVEANIYMRDMRDVPANVTPGYLFSLRQGNGSSDWFVLQKEGAYSVYRVTLDSRGDIPRFGDSQGETTLALQAHEDDLVESLGGRITLSFKLDNIDYTHDLEYDVSSAEGQWKGSSFVVRKWQDNLEDERITAKVINPLQLFNTLCTGRS